MTWTARRPRATAQRKTPRCWPEAGSAGYRTWERPRSAPRARGCWSRPSGRNRRSRSCNPRSPPRARLPRRCLAGQRQRPRPSDRARVRLDRRGSSPPHRPRSPCGRCSRQPLQDNSHAAALHRTARRSDRGALLLPRLELRQTQDTRGAPAPKSSARVLRVITRVVPGNRPAG